VIEGDVIDPFPRQSRTELEIGLHGMAVNCSAPYNYGTRYLRISRSSSALKVARTRI
jgi:hypothetical protein